MLKATVFTFFILIFTLMFNGSMGVSYIMIPFFSILLIFGDRKYKAISLFLLLSCILNWVTSTKIDESLSDQAYNIEFIFNAKISIMWDSALALIFITSKLFNFESGKQAALLCFAVLANIVVAYVEQGVFSDLVFYNIVKIIILINILQMVIVLDGFFAAVRSLSKFMYRAINYCRRWGEVICFVFNKKERYQK